MMLKNRLNNKGFGIAEAIVSMVVISLVSWVTLDAINQVRENQAKNDSYEEARTIAQNAYEFFVFANNANNADDEYSFISLLTNRIDLTTKEVYDYANDDDHSTPFAYTPSDDGTYCVNYETEYYNLQIKVNYTTTDGRPTFSCKCTNSGDKEIFTLSYQKAEYGSVSTTTNNQPGNTNNDQ